MALYEAKTGEAADDGFISAGSGVEGRKERGGQTGLGGDGDDDDDDDCSVYAGRMPSSPET
jgi:hypothetical protein